MEVSDAAAKESGPRIVLHLRPSPESTDRYICDEIEWGVKCSKPFTSLPLFKARIRNLGTL